MLAGSSEASAAHIRIFGDRMAEQWRPFTRWRTPDNARARFSRWQPCSGALRMLQI